MVDRGGGARTLRGVKILSFSYEDLASGWTLETATFDAMNLLVGASGVGKTQVVENLRAVVTVALLDNATLPRAKWVLRYEEGDRQWRWEAETGVEEVESGFPGLGASNTVFVGELLEEEKSGTAVFKRVGKKVELSGKEAPEVPAGRSLFGSFTADAVKEGRDALRNVMFSVYSGRDTPLATAPLLLPGPVASEVEQWIQQDTSATPSVSDYFRKSFVVHSGNHIKYPGVRLVRYPLIWYYGQEVGSPEFAKFCHRFREIFPSVEDLRVRRSDEGDHALLHLEIRERGVPHWIDQSSISAGMLRTLIHLHEFLFAPAGTVIVIDEFENSLGVNCLPVLTELMLERTDCQFIVTSHHPYVIGNIPMSTWRVVQRHGSVVRLLPAQEVPRLRGGSRLDAFTRLLNALQSDDAA